MEFYRTLTSNFKLIINVTDYKVYGNEKVYSKGFQNTPYFYQSAFISVIGSHSNLRCFEKNVQFLPEIMKNNEIFSENEQNPFFLYNLMFVNLNMPICIQNIIQPKFQRQFQKIQLWPLLATNSLDHGIYTCLAYANRRFTRARQNNSLLTSKPH